MLQLDNLSAGTSASQGYVTTNGNTPTTSTISYSINNPALPGNSLQSLAPPHFFPGGSGLVPDTLSQGRGFGTTLHWGTSVFNPISQLPSQSQPLGKSPAVQASGSKNDNPSDEEDDDDYRPFTPPPPRERLSYTRYQLGLLNGIYEEVRYPNSTQKQLIAKRVGITREQVKIWFQNRRRKDVVSKTGSSKTDAEDQDAVNSDAKADDSQGSQADVNSTGGSIANEEQCADPSVLNDASTSEYQTKTNSVSRPSSFSESSECSNSTSEEAKKSNTDGDKNIKDESDRSLTPNSLNVSKLVSPLVLKSMIAELNKFDNEYLKQKKNKKKNKSKSARQAAIAAAKSVSPAKAKRLFQSYDMIAPPNKVTPTAFLNTSANRFKHAGGTSAFQNPRENKIPPLSIPQLTTNDNRVWDGFSLSHSSSRPSHLDAAEILQQQRASLEQSMIPNSFASTFALQNQSHPSAFGGFLSGSTAAAVHHLNTQSPLYENLPVLSELLGSYKHQPNASAAAVASAQRQFEHSLLTSQAGAQQQQSSDLLNLTNGTSIGAGQSNAASCIGNKPNLPFPPSPSHHSLTLNSRHPASFGLNHRVFPFPLIAEPPVMLSNLRQADPVKPQPQWPQTASGLNHPSSGQIPHGNPAGEETLYRPLAISSLSNPYFSSAPPTSYSLPPSLPPPSHLWPANSSTPDQPDYAQL